MPGTVGSSASGSLASNALPIGTPVAEFEITRVVGEGGFSVVYLAFDHTLHRSIALKEYIPSALASRRGDKTVAVRSTQHQETFEAGLRSFINEARLLAQFDHPALVKVYRFWEANGTAYMAMPYYQGRTLKQILRENPSQATEAWLRELLTPLLDALELLHGHRCYHRDIAPDNIQILDNGAPVLLDFGAARRTIGDMTQAFTVILKPGYAPIEQYADETDLKQGPWTDVYALSAVLYGAIVGKPPPTAVARMIKDPLEPLSKRGLSAYSESFLAAIDRGLAVRPEARPQSIGEWRDLLGVPAVRHRAADTSLRAASSVLAQPSLDAVSASPAATGARGRYAGTGALAGSGEGIESAPTERVTDETASASPPETDQTVLVPGLRRAREQVQAHPDPPSVATIGAPSVATGGAPSVATIAAAGDGSKSPRRPAFVRGSMLAASVVAAAVIVAYFVREERAPVVASSETSKSSPPTTTPETRPSKVMTNNAAVTPGGGRETSPPPSDTERASASTASPAGAAKASSAGSDASDFNSPLAVAPPKQANAKSSAEAPRTSAGKGSQDAPPATHAKAAIDAPPTSSTGKPESQDTAASTTGKTLPEPSPSTAKGAPAAGRPQTSEDDRAWSAIRDSRNVADFLAFQLKYPRSSHSRAAALRIKELDQGAKPPKRPAQTAQAPGNVAASPPPAGSPPGEPAVVETVPSRQTPSPAQANTAAEQTTRPPADFPRPPAAAGAQKGVVRIRVRPFGYVYVDGELVGASPPMRELALAYGKHRIEARNSEVRPGVVSTEVDVVDAEPREIQLRFSE